MDEGHSPAHAIMTETTSSELPAQAVEKTPPRKKYVRAVGPRLRRLLVVVFVLVAVLAANSAYLASITFMEWVTARTYQNYFYQVMFLGHLALGLLFLVPFFVFALCHMRNARNRPNRRVVKVGYALFVVSTVVLFSGLALTRIGSFDLRHPAARSTVYWLHVLGPLVAGWLYWLHRLVGPKIKWRIGAAYAGVVGAALAGMIFLHSEDPRQWNVVGPKDGEKYFKPSLARTSTGNFIPAHSLMMDHYCKKCHADVHAGWHDSVHHFSSFNNPVYLASVRETRTVAFKRDGNVQASRWCAGCHDPVPFFSGAFDDPEFDMVNHATSQAGVTCTVCHAITYSPDRGPIGNAEYTIEEPLHYPFAYSDNPVLQWINNQMVKAKPEFHKKTFLKPLHKSPEFCGTCHKVHLPYELTHYKEFLRGQNHYDSYHLSGVSGHGARSFYYPPEAEANCNRCHMPLLASNDFGADLFDDSGTLKIHDHLFPSANTALAWLRDRPNVVAAHQEFLQGTMRVDIFGLRADAEVDGALTAPLRPDVPALERGKNYLLETVIRTLKLGHHFTEGTVDSNEVWLDVTVKSGGEIIGRSGSLDDVGQVDPWSHFVNAFVLDEDGRRIDRRNPQDIVVPLYSHQIPPGAAQTVHYRMRVPESVSDSITVDVKLLYRKFDRQLMQYVADSAKAGDRTIRGHVDGEPYRNELPITVLASDSMTFAVNGGASETAQQESIPAQQNPNIPEWQRWNDYGIGLLLKGTAELRQAAEAFAAVEELGRYDGPLNLARVLEKEGRLDEAVATIARASQFDDPPAPAWTIAWLSGVVNRQQNRLEEAERNFRSVLEDNTDERLRRGFDFSQDYAVRYELGMTLFDRARQYRTERVRPQRDALLKAAAAQLHQVLELDREFANAHYNLALIYTHLDDAELSEHHRALHERYRPDDNARGRVVALARDRYPAANHASEAVVIYDLHREPSE